MTHYQPGPYAPAPPQPPRRSTGAKIAIGLGIGFAALMVLGILGAILGSDDPAAPNDEPKAAAPKDDKPAEPDPAAKEPKPAKDKAAPATDEYGDGDYIVGDDMPAGTYESAGAQSGLFELCSISTEPTAADTMPQWKTANAGERIIIKLAEADGVLTISGCEPLTLRK